MKRRRTLVAITVVAAAWALVPAQAAAAEVKIHTVFGCQGGTQVVPAGSSITLRTGWLAASPGLVREYLGAEATTLTINGTVRREADDAVYWDSPADAVSHWLYPTRVTLDAGESMTFHYVEELDHPLHDGIVQDADGHGFAIAGPGVVVDRWCTVIADGAPPQPAPTAERVHTFFACNDGIHNVAAGREVVLRFAFGTITQGELRGYLADESTSLSVNGLPVAIADSDSLWDGPTERPDLRVSSWEFATGIVLAPGASMTIVYDSVVTHPVYDGISFAGPGSIFGGPIACTITGV